MKKYLSVLVAVAAVVFGLATIAIAKEAIVSGYNSEEFAVKGEVERNILKAVKAIEDYKAKKAGKLQIKVVGSADSSGLSAANDRLSKDRAEAVAAELKSYFPEAQITVVPKGDQANLRQVKVEYILSLASQPITPQFDWRELILFILVGILLISMFYIAMAILFLRTPKKQDVSQAPAKTMKSTQPTKKWVEIDGYYVQTEYAAVEARWYSQFINNSGQRIWEPTETKIVGSIRRCLKNPNFSEQVKDLRETGLIKKLG